MFEKGLAYARLLRLSNGPTAVADVWMGYAVATGSLEPSWRLAALTIASLCLYHGGMALNDARDAPSDSRENRRRPIQLGVVSQRAAERLARGLIAVGVVAGALAAPPTSAAVAVALAGCVVAYNVCPADRRGVIGPPLMGVCRALNGLLGASPALTGAFALATAPSVFLYVTGFSLFARNEVAGDRRRALAAALGVSLLGIIWIGLATPRLVTEHGPTPPLLATVTWGVVALVATRGMFAAVLRPTPRNIGRGVGLAIQGLVLLDATIAILGANPRAGFAILALLPVTMLLSRAIPQT